MPVSQGNSIQNVKSTIKSIEEGTINARESGTSFSDSHLSHGGGGFNGGGGSKKKGKKEY